MLVRLLRLRLREAGFHGFELSRHSRRSWPWGQLVFCSLAGFLRADKIRIEKGAYDLLVLALASTTFGHVSDNHDATDHAPP